MSKSSARGFGLFIPSRAQVLLGARSFFFSLTKKRPHHYKTCDSRRYRYWNWLQGNISSANPVDRTDGKTTYDDFYISDSLLVRQDGFKDIRQDLLNHGLPDLNDATYTYWFTSSKDPDTGEETEEPAYKNIFNTHNGVLIAVANFRENDEADNSLYSIQKTVVNEQTTAVLQLAYTKMGYSLRGGDKTWQKWTEEDTPNWFFALLGTDNCKGTLFLLNQHLVEAGKKEIVEIWTRWDNYYPDIWITIEPAEWVKYLTPHPDNMEIDP
ncbi:MAG: hypothetical protein L6R39_002466 [Caloplaca ligustica]|nr:MAG: hypothetical protein L6R39_002466 [Caloplaca ligustica]